MASAEGSSQRMWTVVFWQHHCRCTDEFETVSEAWRVMTKGEDQGYLSAESITSPGGVTLPVWGREMTEADDD
jgi:hypothetical protein